MGHYYYLYCQGLRLYCHLTKGFKKTTLLYRIILYILGKKNLCLHRNYLVLYNPRLHCICSYLNLLFPHPSHFFFCLSSLQIQMWLRDRVDNLPFVEHHLITEYVLQQYFLLISAVI